MPLPRAAVRTRLAIALTLLLAGAWPVQSARAEIDPPLADVHAPITVKAAQSQRWQEGQYIVWLLHGGCEIRQGEVTARSRDAVLWIDRGQPLDSDPSKIIAYLENDVAIDFARDGSPHQATGRRAQSIEGRSWLGRFHTTAGIDIRAPVLFPEPVARPQMVERSLEALNWTRDAAVRPAQFTSPLPAGQVASPGQPAARSVSIRSRSNVRMQVKSFPGKDPNETIVAINSGVQIVVSGIENVRGIVTGVVTIECDRVVIWTTALAGLNLSGDAIQQAGGRWEFYLEGNLIFREGDRVIYADRMYYNVNENQGTVLNAEMLTPVPKYDGLVRLKADVLQQVDRQNFLAYGAALTSSRMGVPSYWFQAENVSFQDVQRTQLDPFSGQPAVDPNTGEPAVAHELRATSRNNFIYVDGIPVLYWPVFATDVTKPTYYIDHLRFGKDRVFGTQAMVGWDAYQVLGIRDPLPGTDWTVSTDWLSDRGFGAGTKFLYDNNGLLGLPGPYRGSIDAWGIKDDGLDNLGADRLDLFPETDWRGRVLWQHRQMLPQGFQFTGEVGLISDRNFLEQYREQEWDERKDQTTDVELKQYLGNSTWDVSAAVRLNDFFTQTEWLPRFDHFLLGQSVLFDRLTWYEHSQVGYGHLRTAVPPDPINPGEVARFQPLAWEQEAEGLRAASRQEIDLPLKLGPLKVVPYALGEVAYWGEDLSGQDLTRAYGQAGVRAALPFWRVDPGVQSDLFNLNGLAHKIVLDADFFWADASQDLERLPLYDPLDDDSTEHFRRRFWFETFNGVHGVYLPQVYPQLYEVSYARRAGLQGWVSSPSTEIADDQMLTRVGIRQRWQTKRGRLGQERIVDWITFDVEGVVFPQPDRDNFGQTLGLLDYAFRWHLGDRLTLLSDGFADLFADGLRTFTVGGNITRPERGEAYLGYRWIDGPVQGSLITCSLGYRMSEKWIATGNGMVDLNHMGNVAYSAALTRIGESLLVRVGFNADTSRDNVGVNLTIEPRCLPRSRLGRIGGVVIPPPGKYGLE